MQLSANFALREFIRTSTGLHNQPDPEAIENLQWLCRTVLQPLREHLGIPVRITSGFRSPEVNAKIGGAKTSAHMRGLAADVKVGAPEPWDAPRFLRVIWELELPIDQAIGYAPSRGGHVHLGIAKRGAPLRGEYLFAPAQGGYLPWMPSNGSMR